MFALCINNYHDIYGVLNSWLVNVLFMQNDATVLGPQPVRAELTIAQRGSDPGPWDNIVNTHGVFRAELVTPLDRYKLSSLFPRLGRSLQRRYDDDNQS